MKHKAWSAAIVGIVAALIAGAVYVGSTGSASGDGNGIMVTLFLVFLGAVIAMQVVPGAMLFGAMVKALSMLTRKETVKDSRK